MLFTLFLGICLSLAWNSPHWIGGLAREPRGSACLCISRAGVTSTFTTLSIFFFFHFIFFLKSGKWTQVPHAYIETTIPTELHPHPRNTSNTPTYSFTLLLSLSFLNTWLEPALLTRCQWNHGKDNKCSSHLPENQRLARQILKNYIHSCSSFCLYGFIYLLKSIHNFQVNQW